jgi:hypothetical protein
MPARCAETCGGKVEGEISDNEEIQGGFCFAHTSRLTLLSFPTLYLGVYFCLALLSKLEFVKGVCIISL